MANLVVSTAVDTMMQASNAAGIATAAGVGTGDSPTFTGATLSGGTLTGGAAGLTLAAGGTNQNITLTPSGTGGVRIAGAQGLQVNDGGFIVGTGNAYIAGNFWLQSDTSLIHFGSSYDVAFSRASAGVVEINNSTAGTLRDLNARQVSLQNAGSTTSLRVFGSDGGVKTELSSNQGYGMHMAVATRLTWGSGTSLDGTRVLGFLPASTTVLELNDGTTAGRLRDLSLRNVKPTGGSGLAVFTVATLPATAATGLFEGSRAFVTDSNAVSYTAGIGSAVAAGGSTIVPVIYLGGTWRIG